MGPIQSGINQSLAILSLASSQSPQAQAQRKATSDTNAFNKFVKTDQNTPFALGEKSQEMFKDLQGQAIDSNLKAGRTEDLVDINKAKPETDNIKDYIKQVGKEVGIEEVDSFSNEMFERLKKKVQAEKPNITSKEVKDTIRLSAEELKDNKGIIKIKLALQQSNNKLSTKQRIKADMDMMKNALKEDN